MLFETKLSLTLKYLFIEIYSIKYIFKISNERFGEKRKSFELERFK